MKIGMHREMMGAKYNMDNPLGKFWANRCGSDVSLGFWWCCQPRYVRGGWILDPGGGVDVCSARRGCRKEPGRARGKEGPSAGYGDRYGCGDGERSCPDSRSTKGWGSLPFFLGPASGVPGGPVSHTPPGEDLLSDCLVQPVGHGRPCRRGRRGEGPVRSRREPAPG